MRWRFSNAAAADDALQLALGLGVGLLGAFLVLVSRIDLVPDGPEDGLERLAVVGVTIALVIGTWYRVARRT